jgi:murein DD-endopeptidase MepM/ murein hydrolase activator NlpD
VDPVPPLSPSVSGVVTPGGGEVDLKNIAKVVFPGGAFLADTQVTLTTSSSPEVAAVFNDFTSIFRPTNRLVYEIRINTGSLPPVSDTVRIEVAVPNDFLSAISVDHQIELFARLLSNGGEETIDLFELFDATFDFSTKRIIAELPTAVFSDAWNNTRDFEAIVTLASTPGINRIVSSVSPGSSIVFSKLVFWEATTSQCKAAFIQCPLAHGCTATSPFNPARKHPITGEIKPHMGVDYRANEGDNVVAAADGMVETSQIKSGYGETIIIRHDDGSATLYGHLKERKVAVTNSVTKGQSIALSGNTGSLSAAPHLHFEYVPNGKIILSKSRIDPDQCIKGLASGSITVGDNGLLADDAFQVFLDNISIGSTAIGASNVLAVNNLIPGNHSLRIRAIVAPDNIGTYEIRLNDGLTFLGGGTLTSGKLSEGSFATFTIVVPVP